MVLIVSFQFVSFFWLSFQKPFLLCFPLPQLLMYPNLWVLLSIEHSLPIPVLLRLSYQSASFDAGSCLDMLFIKSPKFPEKRSFSQINGILNSTFSFIHSIPHTFTEKPTMCSLGSWSVTSEIQGSQSKGKFFLMLLSAVYSYVWHLISLTPTTDLTCWMNSSLGHLATNYLSQLGRGCEAYPVTRTVHCHLLCVWIQQLSQLAFN